MSDKELDRVNVIQAVCEKRLRRRDAAAQLELTERQDKRSRSKGMPRCRAQARVQEQFRAVNPVLANPDEFRTSLRK